VPDLDVVLSFKRRECKPDVLLCIKDGGVLEIGIQDSVTGSHPMCGYMLVAGTLLPSRYLKQRETVKACRH
jgi:hypothetical protein